MYEEKYDGWRVVAYKDGKNVQLISRAGKDLTARFPELVAAILALGAGTPIPDGEVCRFDERLVSRFEWLHRRPKDETATPRLYMAFDCLHARGRISETDVWTCDETCSRPRSTATSWSRLADEGLTAWAELLARGYEGLVAKDPASPYVGGRTLKWLKVAALPKRGAGMGAQEEVVQVPLPLM